MSKSIAVVYVLVVDIRIPVSEAYIAMTPGMI
jgi:hypothetical protein